MSQPYTCLFWTLYAWTFSLVRFQIRILNEKTQSIEKTHTHTHTHTYIYIWNTSVILLSYFHNIMWQSLTVTCGRSVVFSWYPEHLGVPPDFGVAHRWFSPGTPSTWVYPLIFGVAHHFSTCVVFHILFVFVPYVASFSGLFISLTFM